MDHSIVIISQSFSPTCVGRSSCIKYIDSGWIPSTYPTTFGGMNVHEIAAYSACQGADPYPRYTVRILLSVINFMIIFIIRYVHPLLIFYSYTCRYDLFIRLCVCVCPVMSRHGIVRKAVGAHLLPAQLGDSRLKQMRPSHQEPWCMKIGYTPPPCFSFLSFFHIMFPIKKSTILWVSENPPFSDRPLLGIIGCGGRKQTLQHVVVQCATVRA